MLGQSQRLGAALSLKGEVVDREHRGDVTDGVGDKRLEVVRNQRGMPVVTVHHLRLPPFDLTPMLHQRQHTTREQDEPAIVVPLAVDRGAFEGVAKVTDDVNAGVCVATLGYWRQLNKGTVNITSSAEFGDMGHSPTFFDNLVQVEAAS